MAKVGVAPEAPSLSDNYLESLGSLRGNPGLRGSPVRAAAQRYGLSVPVQRNQIASSGWAAERIACTTFDGLYTKPPLPGCHHGPLP